MAEVSGLMPLFVELGQRQDVSLINLLVPSHSPADNPWDKLKNRFHRSTNGRSSPSPSPFVEVRHEWVGKKLRKIANAAPHAKILLSAVENQFGGVLSHECRELKSRLYAIAHQPPSWMRLHWRDFSKLDDLGGIICLGKEQQSFLESVTKAPTFHIKYGVDLNFFVPPYIPRPTDGFRILFVGDWLRDFDTLTASMEIIWKAYPLVQLDCVIPRKGRQSLALLRLARDSRVQWHAGVSPEKLRELYQRATLLFLPLIDAVANTAIVESLACGLPIVTSRVVGVGDYLPDGYAILCNPGDAMDHADAVIARLADARIAILAGNAGRAFAEEKLNWKAITAELVSYIKSSH